MGFDTLIIYFDYQEYLCFRTPGLPPNSKAGGSLVIVIVIGAVAYISCDEAHVGLRCFDNVRKWRVADQMDRAEHVCSAQGSSDFNLFRNGEGIIDLDTEVPDSAFDLGVTEQELHGAQIAGTSVDQGCLGPS